MKYRDITKEEYLKLKSPIEERLSKLAKLENKTDWAGMPAIGLCKVYDCENEVKIYVLPTFYFSEMINNLYKQALNHKENFGTGDAQDVVNALYENDPYSDCKANLESQGLYLGGYEKEDMVDRLNHDKFCLLIKESKERIENNILKIDLFRLYKSNKKGRYEFIGGLFHTFKHFSIADQPLSINKEIVNIFDISHFIPLIIKGFWFMQRHPDLDHKDGTTYSIINPKESNEFDKPLMLSFFTDDETNLSYLNTMFVKEVE